MIDRVQNRLEPILDRQSRAWLAGGRPTVEELLHGSARAEDPEALLDLIYNEIVVREELGEAAAPEEYLRRFPQLSEDLKLHFDIHRAIGEAELVETPWRGGNDQTLPEFKALPTLPELPDYELVQLLGRGGMGIVYKARQRSLRRTVALKMFEPGRIPTPRDVQRFRTEAEAIARLQHPNIVQIFKIGESDGLPFLALELAENGTLAQRLQQLPFSPWAAAALIETLASAIHHAHEQRIVHRDLKPANILFAADGTPKITDFGLAKLLEDVADSPRDATRTGETIGTPRYMAPEQALGRHDLVGPATDTYALGTLLYECLTGQVPFVSSSVVETLQKISADEPVSPRRLQPSIPRDLATICLRCLMKESHRRYPTAAALADDLRRFLDGRPIVARPTPSWERVWKWSRRRPTHAALIAVAVLLVVLGGIAAGISNRREQRRVAAARDEVELLMKQGQEAAVLENNETAEGRFREAWILVQGEPALSDYRTGVSGWLDHSRRAANRQLWKQRMPPREFDEARDEALLLSLLLDPSGPESVADGRRAIAAALELTLPNDAVWNAERERLVLLDAELVLVDSGAAKALARLDESNEFTSRCYCGRRADLLLQLGRPEEAALERTRAEQHPPNEPAIRFGLGMERIRRRDYSEAARDFDAVLDAEPEHFTARLFRALCALKLDRPGEAKAGLTACVAQRPCFAWNYHYRGMAEDKLGEAAAAARDGARAKEFQRVPKR